MRSRKMIKRLLITLAALSAIALFTMAVSAVRADPYWYVYTRHIYFYYGRELSKEELLRWDQDHAGETLACVQQSTGSLLEQLGLPPEVFACFDSDEEAQEYSRQQQKLRRRE